MFSKKKRMSSCLIFNLFLMVVSTILPLVIENGMPLNYIARAICVYSHVNVSIMAKSTGISVLTGITATISFVALLSILLR